MLTRREKLLVRPWQLRRYNNHRRKVLTAHPVIDFGPPAQRGHVTLKLKKLQKEDERRTKIEEDNFRLLQRMSAIMKKNRLDNHWESEPPTFLRRVGIYHRTRSPSLCEDVASDGSPGVCDSRRPRCLACSHTVGKKPEVHSEERIPWAPAKKSPSTRRESTCASLVIMTLGSKQKRSFGLKENPSSLPCIASNKMDEISGRSTGKHILLEQGSFKLALNFPIYVDVKVKSATDEKYIQRGFCACRPLGRRDRRALLP